VVRRNVVRTAVLVMSALAVGVYIPAPASSTSCAGPGLEVPGAPFTQELRKQEYDVKDVVVEGGKLTAVQVRRGESLTVEGQQFYTGGCGDDEAGGCGRGDDPGPFQPAENVELRLAQGGRSWSLGISDASIGPERRFSITWNVSVPSDADVGPAVLHASGAVLGLRIRP